MSPYRILVASYTDEVATLEFSSGSGSLAVTSSLTVGFHPSWIARHPEDHSLLFTGLEQEDGQLLSLKYDVGTGIGKLTSGVSSGGYSPCTILATKDQVIVGNYMSGTVGVFDLKEQGNLKEHQPLLRFTGTGPNKDRQEQSHPHQVYLIDEPGRQEILIPDLGADRIWRLLRSEVGTWEKKGEVVFDGDLAGGGPRHVAFHDEVLYTLLEMGCQLAAHTLPPLTSSEAPKLLACSPTLLHKPAEPMIAAEIAIPPTNGTFQQAYIYTSNRDDPHPEGDSIAIFTPHSGSSTLDLVEEVRTGLRHVRGMIFFGPHDRFLIAGGAKGGGIKVFERTNGGRGLKEVSHLSDDLKPTSFALL